MEFIHEYGMDEDSVVICHQSTNTCAFMHVSVILAAEIDV